MIIIKRLSRILCVAFMMSVGLSVSGQQAAPSVKTSGNQAVLVENNTEDDLTITLFRDEKKPQSFILSSGESRKIDPDCYRIKYGGSQGNGEAWSRAIKKVAPASEATVITNEEKAPANTRDNSPAEPAVKEMNERPENPKVEESAPPVIDEIIIEDDDFSYKGWQNRATILKGFEEYLEGHNYYGTSFIESERDKVESSIEELNHGVSDPKQYASQLHESIDAMTKNLDRFTQGKNQLIGDYLNQFNNNKTDKQILREEFTKRLDERLTMHEENLNRLSSVLAEWEANQPKHNWPLIGLLSGIAVLLLGLISWFVRRKKNSDQLLMPTVAYQGRSPRQPADREIVVRRKTTSILKKQSLENVVDNPSYLAIDCADFCTSSAVRRIYIKNSCIKDIYNMYAEDLRNPENPKEDGCMVLGRWVHDKEENEYYVSLEEVVKPGDDAVFSEYELNFGGKIKLKVSEKLRKLRRETDLQYDMTCWVHSHPGLGVFFSNQDNTVHMQLKHPTHPHFLTALVIDILTPEQELGIFTFKPDGTLNSKADLNQMYSLEDMYKWAIESERNTFKREDYFDTLAHAKQHENSCHGVHLSNSAIIDIDKLAVEHENGMAGMVHGFIQQEGNFSEIAVSAVCQEERIPDNEPVGCFIITKYCSIPTVRKAIEPHAGKIRFAFVYSTADGLLTTIPIRGRDLITDEAFYGEQKLEDLKIWTRRKR